jgi:hypothetical protein
MGDVRWVQYPFVGPDLVNTSQTPNACLLPSTSPSTSNHDHVQMVYSDPPKRISFQMQEAGSRPLTDTISADRLQELSSALEFYPSQGEAQEMAEEARGEADGNAASEIALERYLEVLEQHRPVEGLDESQLERAFQVRSSGIHTTQDWEREYLKGHILDVLK